jgi:serine/threonine-protein kinase
MAEVYKAQDCKGGHSVAIKVLLPHFLRETSVRQRFQREVRAAARLEHPNIVQVYECGEADGRYYLVMQYIAGPNLGQFLDGHGRLPLTQACRIIQDVANALDYVHRRGLVHRDVKASNVMLDPIVANEARDLEYRAMIMDFGLAKILDESARLSHSGVVGTFGYIAPEQIQSPGRVDGRADVYALGVVAYQMLTGQLPFVQRNPGALLMAHLTQPPPDPRERVPDLPRHVTEALQLALAKRPEDRYPTAGALAEALGFVGNDDWLWSCSP